MGDAKNKSANEKSATEPQGPLGGERLAEARRLQQISVQEIAKELHLDEPKVLALERNEFDVLGAPVFAKGHLRKYSQLVNVDPDDVMADYYQLNRTSAMPPVISGRPRPRREMSPGPWIAVIVVIIVVATAYWWFTSVPTIDSAPQNESVTGELATEDTPAVAESQPVLSEVDDSAVLASAEEPPTTEQPEADGSSLDELEAAIADVAPTPELDDGQMRMLVTYSGDCWTQITDARGRRLFVGLGTDGRTVELSGEAPFNVVFGNAENVSIRVNGDDRPIADSERRGPIARLTIAGS